MIHQLFAMIKAMAERIIFINKGDTYESAIIREHEEEHDLQTKLTFFGKFASKDSTDNKIIQEINNV